MSEEKTLKQLLLPTDPFFPKPGAFKRVETGWDDTLDERLPTTTGEAKVTGKKSLKSKLGVLVILLPVCLWIWHFQRPASTRLVGGHDPTTLCEQEEPLRPTTKAYKDISAALESDDFPSRAAEALGGAVRVTTEVFDDWGPVESDNRWGNFSTFHEYLQETFPKVHAKLSLTKINTYGLLYEWKGTDRSLDPILFMAHQDVVPVDHATYGSWKQGPYSGKLVDGYVWGRGSMDDKSGLIGVMLAAEILLEHGWSPKRSVVLSFGFDEEASGTQGASALAQYLEKHQKRKFAMIVDEGGGYLSIFGRMTAGPAVAEKGYLDVRVKVNSPGGHSSVPPPHTTIGYLALLIAHLEANPYQVALARESPIFKLLECNAAHSPDLPSQMKTEIYRAARGDNQALKRIEGFIIASTDPTVAYLKAVLATTQAVDIIQGGVKSNALPEEAFAIVNHRIATDSSIAALKAEFIDRITPITSKHNLELIGFDNSTVSLPDDARGKVTLSDAWGNGLEPAPVSSVESEAYKVLSGTIRAAWEDANPKEASIVVAPSMMTGNTDTRWYWSLSDNIFRYSHIGPHHGYNGIHTINEALRLDGFVDMVKFFSLLIQNADESGTL